MELLRDIEPFFKEAIPALLEEAGFSSSAQKIRESGPVLSMDAALELWRALDGVSKIVAAFPEIQESVFWAQGALLAGADGDIDLFDECLRMANRSLCEIWPQFAIQ